MHIKHLDIARQKRLSGTSALALAATEGPPAGGGAGQGGWGGVTDGTDNYGLC